MATNKEAATTGVNEFEILSEPKRVNSNRNLIWTFRSICALSLLFIVGTILVALFAPDVEARLGFSPLLFTIYFYYVFLFSNSFTNGLQEHKRLYRDATPEELLAGIKVAAEKGRGLSQLCKTKRSFVDRIQDQSWTCKQTNSKIWGTGAIFFAVLMIGGGYVRLLYHGFGETAVKVTMGRMSLEDAHMSLSDLVLTWLAAIMILIILVTYLGLANLAGWNWGVLNLVNMVKDDIEKDKAQCLLNGGDSGRLYWWIYHIGDIEKAYSESDEEPKVDLGKDIC